MSRNVTIKDIAKEAGVSISTVSRTLNNAPLVTPEKRQRVLEVIGRTGYEPNASAQGLVRGKSMTIGVLTQDIASPFYDEITRGIDAGFSGSGYQPIFVNGHWDAQDEVTAVLALTRRQVDGLIVLGGRLPEAQLHALSKRFPLLMVGRFVPELSHCCLRVDHVHGARLATRHLIELGHRRIAHIAGISSHKDAADRLEGYRLALAEAGLEFHPELVYEGEFDEPSGILAVESWLAQGIHFSAIFAANDQMAYGARLALYRRGIRVPEDVSLVGYDDLPASHFSLPPLTTVRQPLFEMGELAAQTLLRRLHTPDSEVPDVAVTLNVRESTCYHRR
ncbi:LacI family DNA-binding transcriptional regulator [Deinococcus cellulosilyticus]|uniref:LacI family transcriptional regulator n=1 Tax=Deinococcus cellulosilyticus (strain DSM 18568 / NBRC 106333 / KACC 11606 / 5516J-15) TaxID=1223518 RepID=A0A511MY30_DEIC1|nr:LacI family DNA-binding transcriptional regulator [Deinococcus cellulosilyticus]GEM45479.1 LacI family transcriptional regulator [Deinococcus cellulosilyticus NBRC 106333 = KACC 11606]